MTFNWILFYGSQFSFHDLICIVAEEYTAEEEKADAIIRYRSRESEYHSDSDSEDDIKEVDDDEETDHKLEEAYHNLNAKDKTQQRKTLDLSFLYNLGSGRAVSDFLTKFKPSSEDSATTPTNNIEMKDDVGKSDVKQSEEITTKDGVEIRGRNNSVKRRFRSMIERRSMWT